jgi:hypothetical protein
MITSLETDGMHVIAKPRATRASRRNHPEAVRWLPHHAHLLYWHHFANATATFRQNHQRFAHRLRRAARGVAAPRGNGSDSLGEVRRRP